MRGISRALTWASRRTLTGPTAAGIGAPARSEPSSTAGTAAPRHFNMGGIGRHAVVYGVGMLLSRAVAFLMLPVYTRFLTPADYGVMELVEMTLDIISVIAGARLANGIFRYYHKADSETDRRAVVSTALMALAASYAAIGIITCLAAAPLSQLIFRTTAYTLLIRLAAGALAFQSLILVPLTYARAENRSGIFVAANLAKLIISLALNVVLVAWMRVGVVGMFVANLTSTMVVGIVLSALLVRQVGFRVSRAATRNLLRYGVPLMGTQVATFILTFGDRYFLQARGTTSDVGLYSLAYQFGFLLAAIGYIPFEQVWEPARFQIAKRPDRDQIFARGFIYMNAFLVTVGVALMLFVPVLLHVMTTPSFFGAAALVPPILLAYVMQGWSQMTDVGIHVRERTEYVTFANWVAAAIALAAYAVLIPRYHGMGAAVATLIAFTVRWILVYTISQRLWHVRYEWGPILRLLAVAFTVAAGAHALAGLPLWTSFVLRVGLAVAYLAGIWWAGVLSASDRAMIRGFVQSPGVALAWLRS